MCTERTGARNSNAKPKIMDGIRILVLTALESRDRGVVFWNVTICARSILGCHRCTFTINLFT